MVRLLLVVLVLFVFVVPVFAQEDFPRMEMAMGYANIGFPTGVPGTSDRHSGFAMHTGLNFTKALGIENYTGFYSLGNSITLISNLVGGKAAYRGGGKLTPYGVAGIGVSYATSGYYYSGSSFSTRIGGGVDYALSEGFGLRFDVSRMGFHFGTWTSGTAVTAGLVFILAN